MLLLWSIALFCLVFSSQVLGGPWEPTVKRGCNSKAAGSKRSPMSIHVLNVLNGLPARGLQVQCYRLEDSNKKWTELMKSSTDKDGRLSVVGPNFKSLKPATYKVRFETGDYWKKQGHTSFFPYVKVVFTVKPKEKRVHVPLLLSPYSYSTYRGS